MDLHLRKVKKGKIPQRAKRKYSMNVLLGGTNTNTC